MVGKIAPETIEQIREQSDIVSVVGDYVKLKQAGDNHFGLCPFHGEKTPSFSVNSSRQFFYCFGCGAGGNVFNFLMRIEGLGFAESVHRLGSRVGIEIQAEQLSPRRQQQRQERERQQQIMVEAVDFYHNILLRENEGAEARAYLRRRGYTGEMVRRFRLGYAPAGWDTLCAHLKRKDIDLEQAVALGLVRRSDEGREYDMFRRRLLFPVQDSSGHAVAFGGRVLDNSLPKYINSPETPLYHKGRILYGMHDAKSFMRRQRRVIVVEGYFDHLALVQAGVENVVATCGTALTAEHATLLKRYVDTLVLLFDQDKAGQAACFRALPLLLQAGLQVQNLSLEQGEDPDSFLARHGKEAFEARLEQTGSALEHFMQQTLAARRDSAEEQARAIAEILDVVAYVPGEIETSLHLQELARRTGVDTGLLQRQLDQLRNERSRASQVAPIVQVQKSSPRREVRRPVASGAGEDRELKAQKMLLALMAERHQVTAEVMSVGIQSLFSHHGCRECAELISKAYAQGQEPGLWLLDQCEDSEVQEILTAALVDKDQFAAEIIEKVFNDCRTAVNHSQLKQRTIQLHAQMCEAERNGDMQMQNECMRELMEINRKIKR
ncbi:MAG: DNA primase [Desulfuromonadaceae bacterium]|nr:DNA primase [Desulfuromonadaceae bacterium]